MRSPYKPGYGAFGLRLPEDMEWDAKNRVPRLNLRKLTAGLSAVERKHIAESEAAALKRRIRFRRAEDARWRRRLCDALAVCPRCGSLAAAYSAHVPFVCAPCHSYASMFMAALRLRYTFPFDRSDKEKSLRYDYFVLSDLRRILSGKEKRNLWAWRNAPPISGAERWRLTCEIARGDIAEPPCLITIE